MSDNKLKKDYRDRTRINTSEPYEIDYWTEKWEITPAQLAKAIKSVASTSVKKVEEYLKNNKLI
jgi:hypothetical protein